MGYSILFPSDIPVKEIRGTALAVASISFSSSESVPSSHAAPFPKVSEVNRVLITGHNTVDNEPSPTNYRQLIIENERSERTGNRYTSERIKTKNAPEINTQSSKASNNISTIAALNVSLKVILSTKVGSALDEIGFLDMPSGIPII